MPPKKIMLIRHGEKQPENGPPPNGVDEQGNQDKHSLSPRGWQRAGALVKFFRKPSAVGIETPNAIYASRRGDIVLMADGHDISKSLRPQQTVTPLSEALGLELQTPYPVGEEQQLAQALVTCESEVVLVAWEHHHIPTMARYFSKNAPTEWPSNDTFDLVWVLDWISPMNYSFSVTSQSLLAGDLPQ